MALLERNAVVLEERLRIVHHRAIGRCAAKEVADLYRTAHARFAAETVLRDARVAVTTAVPEAAEAPFKRARRLAGRGAHVALKRLGEQHRETVGKVVVLCARRCRQQQQQQQQRRRNRQDKQIGNHDRSSNWSENSYAYVVGVGWRMRE